MAKKKPKTPDFLPTRPAEHITGEQAVLEFRRSVPGEWIIREAGGDYGIDCEVEVVEKGGGVSGARVLAQLKGTSTSSEKTKTTVQVKSSSVRYWVSLPIPVIVVRVTENPPKVLWLDVRSHLAETGRLDTIFATQQATLSFNFSDANELPQTSNLLRDLAVQHQTAVAQMKDEADAQIVEQYVGYHVLYHLFDNDVEKWIKWLREEGLDEQLIHDYPFAVWVREQQKADPDFLDKIHRMVTETTMIAQKKGTRSQGASKDSKRKTK